MQYRPPSNNGGEAITKYKIEGPSQSGRAAQLLQEASSSRTVDNVPRRAPRNPKRGNLASRALHSAKFAVAAFSTPPPRRPIHGGGGGRIIFNLVRCTLAPNFTHSVLHRHMFAVTHLIDFSHGVAAFALRTQLKKESVKEATRK